MSADQSRPLKPADEALLVARARQHDSAAFVQLYDAYLDRIYRHLYYRVTSTSEAEDLTEQVFLTAWDLMKRGEYRGTSFRAWLYRLAHSLVLGRTRPQRVPSALDDAAAPERDDADVVEAIKRAPAVASVRAAFVALSPEHQQLIVLRFVEGVSLAEVSHIMGQSEDTTRVIQHRALQALGRILAARGMT